MGGVCLESPDRISYLEKNRNVGANRQTIVPERALKTLTFERRVWMGGTCSLQIARGFLLVAKSGRLCLKLRVRLVTHWSRDGEKSCATHLMLMEDSYDSSPPVLRGGVRIDGGAAIDFD